MATAKRAPKPKAIFHPTQVAKDTKPPEGPKHVPLTARNAPQRHYIKTMKNLSNDIVFAMGPAGTGKTLLAVLFAISEYEEGNIKKIIITRPVMPSGDDLGYLPGDIREKMDPWMRPVLDVFAEVYSPSQVDKLLDSGTVEIAPLTYMRGRTFKHAIVIGDEMQNATPEQMKMFLTRIGDGSRMVVTGDVHQHDRGAQKSGLVDIVERLHRGPSDRIGVVSFTNKDVERHPVITDVLALYDE